MEEAAYDAGDLRRGRALARSGAVGAIAVSAGVVRSAVEERGELWSVGVDVPVLDGDARAALVEAVAAQAGRPAALLAGDLPHDLVEHAEEAGVELLPYGGELAASCTCAAWVDPCAHALAVLLQAGWLVEDDPFVLLGVRGLPRDDLLAALHRRTAVVGDDDATWSAGEDLVLATALEAAERAGLLLEELADSPAGPADDTMGPCASTPATSSPPTTTPRSAASSSSGPSGA